MERREFLAGAALSGAAITTLGANAEEKPVEREYYEHRTYQLLPGDRNGAIHAFLEKAAIPAWNRAGIGPVGVFTGVYGGEWTNLEVLLPHASLAAYAAARATLAADEEFQKAGAEFLDTPPSAPNFVRYETNLMLAFSGMPKLAVPEKKDRIFELRTYESHSEKAALSKMAMFDNGETELMRDLGMSPMFFGQGIAGPNLPHLRYITAGSDLAAHLAPWAKFGPDPRWVKMKDDPQYKDNTSKNTARFLAPTAYSQI